MYEPVGSSELVNKGHKLITKAVCEVELCVLWDCRFWFDIFLYYECPGRAPC